MNESTITIHPCEKAKQEFYDSWAQGKNSIGQGNYQKVAEKVRKIVLKESLPFKEIILHYHHFRFGFPIFYGEEEGRTKFLPIRVSDGQILNWQYNNVDKEQICWPIKDYETGTYFIPKITVNRIKPPSGSTPTEQYLDKLVEIATLDKNSREYRILEALIPYSVLIAKAGAWTYYNITELIPEYKGNSRYLY